MSMLRNIGEEIRLAGVARGIQHFRDLELLTGTETAATIEAVVDKLDFVRLAQVYNEAVSSGMTTTNGSPLPPVSAADLASRKVSPGLCRTRVIAYILGW